MAAKAWIDAFLLIEANDNEWKIPFLFRSDFFEIIETSMEEVFFHSNFFFLKWISESEDKKPFCRSFKEKEIFWQKVSIHSRIKESWIFYLNISFVRRCRVLNGMEQLMKQDFLLLNQDHETFFYSYHLLSWCCLFVELVKEATSCALTLELSSFSFQTLLIRLITF